MPPEATPRELCLRDQRSMLGGAFKRLKGLCRTQAGIGGHLLRILQTKQTDEKSSVDLCTAVGRTYQGEEAAGRAAKLIDRLGSFKRACTAKENIANECMAEAFGLHHQPRSTRLPIPLWGITRQPSLGLGA